MKIISSFLFSALVFAQVTSVIAASGSELIDNEIAGINASITGSLSFNAAPIYASVPLAQNEITYTSWELIHRIPMLAGFQWAGEITQFITPQMYIGTPFTDGMAHRGQTSVYNTQSSYDPTTYKECLINESYISFGLGQRIENTDIKELKAIAKACAKEFYGSYFDGKSYTTREEYLMMLLTMFGEDVRFDGQFTPDGKYREAGTGFDSHFENIPMKSWYAPYIGRSYDMGIIPSNTTTWKIAQELNDTEAINMLLLYTKHHMNFSGDILNKWVIITPSIQYLIEFVSEHELSIRVQ